MKKVLISACLLLAVVVLILFVQNRNGMPSGKDGSGKNSKTATYDRGVTTADDSDPAPESVFAVKDGILYSTGLSVGPAPAGYFKDALFIGDSRTVGLSNYGGGLDGATWFCAVSMGVMNYEKKDVKVEGYGNIKLDDLLSKKSFKKIYINMGINEIGYDMATLQKRYVSFVDMLREKCPDAKIILMSNLHVTKSRSDSDKWVNNPRINELNDSFKAQQDGRKIFYMDINPIFDDAAGNLDPQYSTDNTHLLGKHYGTLAEYIAQHAITDTGV